MADWKFESLLKPFDEHAEWDRDAPKSIRCVTTPGRLWLAYPWSFGDPLEGTMPAANESPEEYCDRVAKHLGDSPEEAARKKAAFLSRNTEGLRRAVVAMAQLCGVSCWHASDTESDEMWDFVPDPNGVAIRTTVGKLEHAIAYASPQYCEQAGLSSSSVAYVDHDKAFLPQDGFRCLLGLIRTEYDYEKEVRCVLRGPKLVSIPQNISKPLPLDPSQWNQSVSVQEQDAAIDAIRQKAEIAAWRVQFCKNAGFHLPLKLDGFFDEVVFKGTSDAAYEQEVSDLLLGVNLSSIPVSQSRY